MLTTLPTIVYRSPIVYYYSLDSPIGMELIELLFVFCFDFCLHRKGHRLLYDATKFLLVF